MPQLPARAKLRRTIILARGRHNGRAPASAWLEAVLSRCGDEQEVSNRGSPEAARLGALQALAALSDVHGRSLASSALESLALAVKFTARCACHPRTCSAGQLLNPTP